MWPSIVGAAEVWLILIGGGVLVAQFRPDLGSAGPWSFAAAFVICIGVTLFLRWWWGRWEMLDVIGRDGPVLEHPDQPPLGSTVADSTTSRD